MSDYIKIEVRVKKPTCELEKMYEAQNRLFNSDNGDFYTYSSIDAKTVVRTLKKEKLRRLILSGQIDKNKVKLGIGV